MNSNFLCSECASCFRERWELTSHIKNIHDTRVFKCSICDENVVGQGKFDVHKKKHKMCTEDKLNNIFRETIQNFRECFEVFHELFDISETQKIYAILDLYRDYFEMMGENVKETNGEHHEALHHTLKTMGKKGFVYEGKNGSPTNQKNPPSH